MAQKRLNRNLVAGITITGMILAIASVAITTVNLNQKDPELLAQRARDYEARGEQKLAIDKYRKAYLVSNDAKYLIEAARICYAMGELQKTLGLLSQARAQAPNDPTVMKALLERYWELREVPLRQWSDVLSHADALLQVEPQNLLALVSRVEALDYLAVQDASNAAKAEEAMQQAVKINPTDERVAMIHALRVLRQGSQGIRDLLARGRKQEAERLAAETRKRGSEILMPAIAVTPTSNKLRSMQAQLLMDSKDAEGALKVLEDGVAAAPKDPEMLFAAAKLRLRQIGEMRDAGAGADALLPVAQAGVDACERAITIEPELFGAYAVRAELQRELYEAKGEWAKAETRVARQKEILDAFGLGATASVGRQTIRGLLGRSEKALMITQAFDAAMNYYRAATNDAEKEQAITFARKFKADAAAQFPDMFVVPLMDGQLAIVERDPLEARKAFHRAEERLGDISAFYSRMVKEQLARLYAEAGETGESLKYTEAAIALSGELQQEPSRWLILNRAQSLLVLDRAKESLDALDAVKAQYSKDTDWLAIRARVLTSLGRGEEALESLKVAGGNTRIMLDQARIAAINGDWETSIGHMRDALAAEPDNPDALRMYVNIMTQADRRDEAIQTLTELAAKTNREGIKRVIEAYKVMLGERDVAKRNEQLFALINAIPDEAERASEQARMYSMMGDYVKAGEALDRLEKLRPDDSYVLLMQFENRLRQQQFDRAEQYAKKLTDLNVDRAGGARFRGALALARGAGETALAEYRAAERDAPSDSSLKTDIARALLTVQPPRYEEAMAALREALAIDPRSFLANKLMYVCYEDTQRSQEGIPYLEAAAKMDSSDEYIKERQQLIDEERNPRKGIEWREKARADDPYNIPNLVRLCELYMNVEEWDKAEEAILAAQKVDASKRNVAQTGARLFGERGDREKGEQFLRTYIESRDSDGRVGGMLLLGRFFAKLGLHEDAQKTIEEAERLADASTGADRAQLKLLSIGELAEQFARMQRYADMVATYRRALGMIPETEVQARQEVRLKVLQGLLAMKDMGEFQKESEAFSKDYPDDARGLKLVAESQLQRRELEPARQTLSRVLAITPSDAWALYSRGRCNIELQRYNEAREDLVKAKTLQPLGFRLAHRAELSRLYEITEQYAAAEAELRSLFTDSKGDRTVALQLIRLLRNIGEITKAQDFVNRLIAEDPQEPFWYYQLGVMFLERQEYSAAVNPLAKAVELTEGKNPIAVADLIASLTRANRAAEAVQVFEGLKPELVTAGIRANAGGAYVLARQKEKATDQFFRGILDGSLNTPEMLNFVVSKAIETLGWQEAQALLRRAIEVAESKPEAKSHLETALARYIVSYGDKTQLAEAVPLVERLLATAQPDSSYHAEGLLIRARIEELNNEFEKAVKTYQEVLQRFPNLPTALNNLAYLLADSLHRPAEAVPDAERAREVAPGVSSVLDTVGWVYYLNENLGQAEAALLEALRLAPTNVNTRVHLAETYLKGKRMADGRRALEKALQDARAARDTANVEKIEARLREIQ